MNYKIMLGAAVIVFIAALVFTFVNTTKTEEETVTQSEETNGTSTDSGSVREEALGIAFAYEPGPDGYRLIRPETEDEYPSLLASFVLMQEADYQSVERGERDGGEGPPTINVLVFENEDGLDPKTWAEGNNAISGIGLVLSGEPESGSISGAPALHYIADGLYATDTYVVASGEHIYLLTGSYIEAESKIHSDFETFLSSIQFI